MVLATFEEDPDGLAELARRAKDARASGKSEPALTRFFEGVEKLAAASRH
jgi:hypothetical protein